jgi:hypothetical protein
MADADRAERKRMDDAVRGEGYGRRSQRVVFDPASSTFALRAVCF